MDTCYLMVRYNHLYSVDGRILIEYSRAQLLSTFAAVPPLILTARLIYNSRRALLHSIQHLPGRCSAEVRYLITGFEPGPLVKDGHLPFAVTSYPEERALGKPRDQITTSVRPTYRPLLLSEPGSAMGWGASGDEGTRSCARGSRW